MCSFILHILVILILRAYAKELMNSIGNKPDLMHNMLDELRMQDQWLHQREDKNPDLDATTLGKPSHIAMSHQSLLPLQPQFSQRRWLQRNAEALEPLVQHTIQAAMKGCFGARAFANVAYGAAGAWKSVGVGKSVGFTSSLCELFAAIAKEAKQCLDEFNAQNLANTAWAFATVAQMDGRAGPGTVPCAEPRQHCMGVCDSGSEE